MATAFTEKAPAATEATDVAAAIPKRKLGPTVFLLLNSLLLVGVLLVLVFKPGQRAASDKRGEEAEKSAKAEADPKASQQRTMVPLADFVVHLRNPDVERYARISFELELAGGDAEKEKLTRHLAELRESFIAYLSDRTLEDLRGSQGIHATKTALFQKLKEIAPDASPRALFITDLVIQ